MGEWGESKLFPLSLTVACKYFKDFWIFLKVTCRHVWDISEFFLRKCICRHKTSVSELTDRWRDSIPMKVPYWQLYTWSWIVNRYLREIQNWNITLWLHRLLVVELECLRELVHELPGGVDELGENWRDLLAVPRQETAPAHILYFYFFTSVLLFIFCI